MGTESARAITCRREKSQAHLGVLELLFDVANHSLALVADEGAVDQLGPDLARPGDCSRDAGELSNLLGPHVANALDEREVVEGEGEGADVETRGGSGIGV